MPPPVRQGDLVGVAALSSRPAPDRLEAGVAQLESLGLRVRVAANLDGGAVSTDTPDYEGLLAGDDHFRVESFHDLVRSEEVRAVFFARGGHGLLRVLPAIDWQLLARYPKAYVGYSDLTPLLVHLVQKLGLVTFHGPMIATDLDRALEDSERSTLMSSLEGRLPAFLECQPVRGSDDCEGTLLGGCLSLLVATLGTEYSPDFRDCLLFLEDVGEPLYRIDRMLTQLHLSGSLRDLKGMILGHLEAADQQCDPAAIAALSLSPAGAPTFPVACGLDCGHGRPNLTLPLGVRAVLRPARGRLELVTPGTLEA